MIPSGDPEFECQVQLTGRSAIEAPAGREHRKGW